MTVKLGIVMSTMFSLKLRKSFNYFSPKFFLKPTLRLFCEGEKAIFEYFSSWISHTSELSPNTEFMYTEIRILNKFLFIRFSFVLTSKMFLILDFLGKSRDEISCLIFPELCQN